MRMVLAATTRRIVAVFGRDITFREAKVSFGAPNSWQAWEAQVASNNTKEAEGALRLRTGQESLAHQDATDETENAEAIEKGTAPK